MSSIISGVLSNSEFYDTIYLIKYLAVVIHLSLSRGEQFLKKCKTLMKCSSSFYLAEDWILIECYFQISPSVWKYSILSFEGCFWEVLLLSHHYRSSVLCCDTLLKRYYTCYFILLFKSYSFSFSTVFTITSAFSAYI